MEGPNKLSDGEKKPVLELLIDSCIKYAQLYASNKEKVAASSVRALGFIAQNLIVLENNQKKNADQNEVLKPEIIHCYIIKIIDILTDKLYD